MLTLKSDWLRRGYFVLADHPVMPTIRERLTATLGGRFQVRAYPSRNWLSTIWWHQREDPLRRSTVLHAGAGEYPILSFGVSVEKGLEDATAAPSGEPDWVMTDRRAWEWHRLLDVAEHTLGHDVSEVASALGSPIDVRIFASRREGGVAKDREHRSFVFYKEQWWERHVGTATPGGILEHLRQLDQRPAWWVDLFFACDLHPGDVDGIGAEAAADMLLQFRELRARLNARD